MAIALVQEAKSGISRAEEEATLAGMHELLVFYPKCKALETLLFIGGQLMQTCKFSETDGRVYHDCGSEKACRYTGLSKEARREIIKLAIKEAG